MRKEVLKKVKNLAQTGTVFLMLAGGGAHATIAESSEVTPAPTGFAKPHPKETKKYNELFFHNDRIGLEKSPILPGVIDIIRIDEKGEKVRINNAVPEVIVNGNRNNAEMFGLDTDIRLLSHEDGIQTVAIAYGKFEGTAKTGDYEYVGNGAHITVLATIPDNKSEITFQIVAHEDSALIDYASLGNFFGAASPQGVQILEVDDRVYQASDFDDPKDGNFVVGDFYELDAPISGQVQFYGEFDDFIQMQVVNTTTTSPVVLDIEIRSKPWRPEHNDPNNKYNPGRKWIELIRMRRGYFPDNTITFRIVDK